MNKQDDTARDFVWLLCQAHAHRKKIVQQKSHISQIIGDGDQDGDGNQDDVEEEWQTLICLVQEARILSRCLRTVFDSQS